MIPFEKIQETIGLIINDLRSTPWIDLGTFGPIDSNPVRKIIDKNSVHLPEPERERILNEFFAAGPIQSLLKREDVSEILINGPREIWIEIDGLLRKHDDTFYSDLTFRNFLHYLSKEMSVPITIERPFVCGSWNNLRVHISGEVCTQNYAAISIRKPACSPWTFETLFKNNWCSSEELAFLSAIVEEKENFLIIGPTGAGKTSVISACLQAMKESERVVILEDTPEIKVPNTCSTKLLTRQDPQGLLPEITLSDLVKQALRMRPDRLVMGEVRGSEAKDLLLALSTGHSGSVGTLHARSGPEAMLRLEMLVQLGAPEWALNAIRRLIFLSLKYIVVVGKTPSGNRHLEGIYRIASLEDFGFLLEKVTRMQNKVLNDRATHF